MKKENGFKNTKNSAQSQSSSNRNTSVKDRKNQGPVAPSKEFQKASSEYAEARKLEENPIRNFQNQDSRHDNKRLEIIRLKAYELYEKRGCSPGRALDDWLEAERMVNIF